MQRRRKRVRDVERRATAHTRARRELPARGEGLDAVAVVRRPRGASAANDKEIHHGEHDAIPAERREVALLDVAEERLDGEIAVMKLTTNPTASIW
jgi:hypothetical protein